MKCSRSARAIFFGACKHGCSNATFTMHLAVPPEKFGTSVVALVSFSPVWQYKNSVKNVIEFRAFVSDNTLVLCDPLPAHITRSHIGPISSETCFALPKAPKGVKSTDRDTDRSRRSSTKARSFFFSRELHSPSRVYRATHARRLLSRQESASPRALMLDATQRGASGESRESVPGTRKRARDLRGVCGKLHARLVYRPMPAIDRRLGHGTRPTRAAR